MLWFLYKPDQFVYKPMHMVRCDALRCVSLESDAVIIVQTRSVRVQTDANDPIRSDPIRCDALRCVACNLMLWFFVQTRSVGVQTDAYGPMRCAQSPKSPNPDCSFCRQIGVLCSPNEDFGRHNKSLWPQNEDFGSLNKALRVRFWSTFQGCEYSFWATTD